MRTIKEALEDGSLSLEDEIDYDDTPQGEEIACLKLEIERIKQEHEAIKKYVHNHTITYIDNGIECCKPDEYFNISCVEDMLNGNFDNLDVLFEDGDK